MFKIKSLLLTVVLSFSTTIATKAQNNGGAAAPQPGSDLAHLRETFPNIRYAVGLRNTRKRLYAANGQELDLSIVATEPEYLYITRSAITPTS